MMVSAAALARGYDVVGGSGEREREELVRGAVT